MSRRVYDLLLHALPRRRRERFGAEMAAVFSEVLADARRHQGRTGAARAWLREARGICRFSWRELVNRVTRRIESGSLRLSGGGWNLPSEFRWAWRGVRARGWRAALTMALLAVVLAANTIVFAVSDALVFNRVTWPDSNRLAQIQVSDDRGRSRAYLNAETLDVWRGQHDLVTGVEAWMQKFVYVVRNGRPRGFSLVDVTPGLIDLVGVRPVHGRSLIEADATRTNGFAVVLTADLAAELFGTAEAAVGGRLETTHDPLLVVGVMPADFRFPEGGPRIWRAFDLRGPLTANRGGFQTVSRLAPGLTIAQANERAQARSSGLSEAVGLTTPRTFAIVPLPEATAESEAWLIFGVLLGAVLSLLFTACANVAGMELAMAIDRSRVHAVQLALGASRTSLARVLLFEGILLVGGAVLAAVTLTYATLPVLVAALPRLVAQHSANVIDVDLRALGFMALAAAATWLTASLPGVVQAWRPSLVGLLKLDGRAPSPRSSAWIRRTLTAAQVTLAVLLLLIAAISVRSYAALIAVDKGYDSTNVAELTASFPIQALGDHSSIRDALVRRVNEIDGVQGLVEGMPPPTFGTPFGGVQLAWDGEPFGGGEHRIAVAEVAPEIFTVLGIPLRYGRLYEHGEAETQVVVTERFARLIAPDGNAVGRRFAISLRNRPTYVVVGVVGDMASAAEPLTDISTLTFFHAPPPPVPPEPNPTPRVDTGGSFGYLSFLVRLDSRDRSDDVLAVAQALDPRFSFSLSFVDDSFADTYAPILLASRLVGGFGLLAFAVSMAGVYGVMAFLVARRRREIGIRMALGAGLADVRGLVLGSSSRLVVLGAALGGLGAWTLVTFVRSQVPGIAAPDVPTFGVVLGAVGLTALLATWHPARQAARVDPAITLRAE